MDAIMEGNDAKALSLWQEAEHAGETAGKLIYMLGETMKLILLLQSMRKRNIATAAMQQRTGRPAFVIKKFKPREKIIK